MCLDHRGSIIRKPWLKLWELLYRVRWHGQGQCYGSTCGHNTDLVPVSRHYHQNVCKILFCHNTDLVHVNAHYHQNVCKILCCHNTDLVHVNAHYHQNVCKILCCHNTDLVHVNGHDVTILVILAKYCTRLPDDGSSVIWNTL